MKKEGDYILTINSDDELEPEESDNEKETKDSSSSSEEESSEEDSSSPQKSVQSFEFDDAFRFDVEEHTSDVEDTSRNKFAEPDDNLEEPDPVFRQPAPVLSDSSDDEEPQMEESDDSEKETRKTETKKQDNDHDELDDDDFDKEFFQELKNQKDDIHFTDMNLSRPLLRAIDKMGYEKPTLVQARCIPPLLNGQDICASAVTGSGKTAAFVLPILERLLFRNKDRQEIRVLILLPTRELAKQCYNVAKKLAVFTDIRFGLAVGGEDLKKQQNALYQKPDVVIATPGRILDHLINTPGIGLEHLEILVLDEADKLLDVGFEAELEQIIEYCPKNRQSMLFSATMTDKVDKLIKLSLKNPVRVQCNPKTQVSTTLTQEFIKVKPKKEQDKPAMLLSLCTRSFTSSVIIFCNLKSVVRYLRIIFYLRGLPTSELHSDLTQSQRYKALERFRKGITKYLICTDIASRGIDILGIKTVINYDMPKDLKTYIHRVGRTARMGRQGTSVSFVGEADRPLLKKIVKRAKKNNERVKHRIIPPEVISYWNKKLEKMEPQIKAIKEQIATQKEIRKAEIQIQREKNIEKHKDEIMSRPKREWFQSNKERKEQKKRAREEKGLTKAPPKKKKKSNRQERKKNFTQYALEMHGIEDSKQYFNAVKKKAKREDRLKRAGILETSNKKKKKKGKK